jgi:hypothetical protein
MLMRAMIPGSRKACELAGTRGRRGVLIDPKQKRRRREGWGIEARVWLPASVPPSPLRKDVWNVWRVCTRTQFPPISPVIDAQECLLETMQIRQRNQPYEEGSFSDFCPVGTSRFKSPSRQRGSVRRIPHSGKTTSQAVRIAIQIDLTSFT